MRITDNTCEIKLNELLTEADNLEDLSLIANKKIDEIMEEYPNLLVFPNKKNAYIDDIHTQEIFSIKNNAKSE